MTMYDTSPSLSGQFLKFSAVGLASNAILYFGYLALTAMGTAPKLAMSILYVFGVLQTFVLNRKWTFESDGNRRTAMGRYVAMYAVGYVANYTILSVFVGRFGFPHQAVQLAAIMILALAFFVTARYWVFGTQSAV